MDLGAADVRHAILNLRVVAAQPLNLRPHLGGGGALGRRVRAGVLLGQRSMRVNRLAILVNVVERTDLSDLRRRRR